MKERRQFPRVPQPFEAQYRHHGELMASWVTVRILNLGAGGIRFRGEEAIPAGTVLEIRMTLPIADEPLMVRGQVIWSQSIAAGVVEHGVSFTDVIPEQAVQIDELVQFLMKSKPPSA